MLQVDTARSLARSLSIGNRTDDFHPTQPLLNSEKMAGQANR